MLRQITRWFIALIALTLIAATLLTSNILSSHAAAPHTTPPAQHQVSPNMMWGGF